MYDPADDHDEVMQRFAALENTTSAIQYSLDEMQSQIDTLMEMAQFIIDRLEAKP